MRDFATIAYIIFDDQVAIPSHYTFAPGSYRKLILNEMIIPGYGLVLPAIRFYPDGGLIDKNFFESPEYNHYTGIVFCTLDHLGYVNEYFIGNGRKLEKWPLPLQQKRLFRSDSFSSQPQFNRMLERSFSIEEAIHNFEKVTGIPSDIFNIYNRTELHKLVNGKIRFEDLTVKSVKSQYKLIWLM